MTYHIMRDWPENYDNKNGSQARHSGQYIYRETGNISVKIGNHTKLSFSANKTLPLNNAIMVIA